jgi:ferrochelatase
VVDIHPILRALLVHVLIVPRRAHTSAKAYQEIWTQEGSPLVAGSERLAKALQKTLGDAYCVISAMRYARPSIRETLDARPEIARWIILPLFPQYASSSTGSAVEEALRHLTKRDAIPAVSVLPAFYDEDFFVDAWAQHMKTHVDPSAWDHVLMSFHGLPQRHIRKVGCPGWNHDNPCQKPVCAREVDETFCYRGQCYRTAERIRNALGMPADKVSVSFQSRLGRTPWIKPYTDVHLQQLYQQGVRRLVVTSPSFVTDCLETLEEIAIRAKQQWLELGGEDFVYAPCLNDSQVWVDGLAAWIDSYKLR